MYKLVVSHVPRNTQLRHLPGKKKDYVLCTTHRNIQPRISLLEILKKSLNKLHTIILA